MLKEYPRLNLRRAFWNWYLNTTSNGAQLFQTAADNLVLYTNCNRITAFYRLKSATFGKRNHFYVSPALKRKIVMLTATLKLFLRKHKHDVFQKIKNSADTIKKTAIRKILEVTNQKQLNSLKMWLRNTKIKNEVYKR